MSDRRICRTLDYYETQGPPPRGISPMSPPWGLDETAARRGHAYVSLWVVSWSAGPRLIFACEDRKAAVVEQFADNLEAHGGCADNIQSSDYHRLLGSW